MQCIFWHFVFELQWIACYCFDIFPDCRFCCVSWEPGKLPRNETCCWWFHLYKQVAEAIALVLPLLASELKVWFEKLFACYFSMCEKCQLGSKHNCTLLFFGSLIISNTQYFHDIFIFRALQNCGHMFCASLHLCQLHCKVAKMTYGSKSVPYFTWRHWSVPEAFEYKVSQPPFTPRESNSTQREKLGPLGHKILGPKIEWKKEGRGGIKKQNAWGKSYTPLGDNFS